MLTGGIPEELEKKIKIKINNRTNAIETEENPDLPLSFIKNTLEAKKEIENGLCKEYKFGVID